MLPQTILISFLLFTASSFVLNEEECLDYTVYPVEYELTISPYIWRNQKSYYDCDLAITVISNAAFVNTIELYAKNLEIRRESIKVLNRDGKNIINRVRPYEYDVESGKLILFLSETLEQYSVRNAKYYIHMTFRKNNLEEERNGIFLMQYKENGVVKHVLNTRLRPDTAKYFFPCFENPLFEAVYKFKIHRTEYRETEKCDVSLVVADERRRRKNKENSETVEYKPSPQIGVHQASFHHSDFHYKEVKSHYTNDTITVWAPETTLPRYRYILECGQRILNLISEYSGVKRPLTSGSINVVSLPANFEAYEVGSWNLLSIGDHKLSYTPQLTSIQQKEEMFFLLAQQLCRIWLGNPGEIERTRWKEEWFKEGLATYLAHYFLSWTQYSAYHKNNFGQHLRNEAMSLDWHRNTPSLSTFDRTLAVNIPDRYKKLVQYKTAAILWMVENWLGTEKFHDSIVKYINSRRGKYISIDDFTTFLQANTVECAFFNGSTVTDVFNSWIKRPGHPVVKVIVYRNGGIEDVVYLEQKQMLPVPSPKEETFRQHHSYMIPISYIKQHNHDCYNCYQHKFTIENTGYSFKENLHGGWIVLNRNASGFYRVNYDDETWRMIIATLKSDDRNKIDTLNRAQIINDAYALYISRDIDFKLAFAIISCLERETEPLVWESAFQGFQLLHTERATELMSRQKYWEFMALMRKLIAPMYASVWSNINEDHAKKSFRRKLINFACLVGYRPCLTDIQSTMRQIEKGGLYDPDLGEIAYYELLNKTEWSHRERYEPTNRFELEDLTSAKEKLTNEAYLRYKLRYEKQQPMPLVVGNTTNSPSTAQPDEQKFQENLKTSAASNLYVKFYLLLANLYIVMLN